MLNYQGLNLTDIFSKSPRYPTLFCDDNEIQVIVLGMEIYQFLTGRSLYPASHI